MMDFIFIQDLIIQNYLYEVDENGNVTNNPLDKNGENVFWTKTIYFI